MGNVLWSQPTTKLFKLYTDIILYINVYMHYATLLYMLLSFSIFAYFSIIPRFDSKNLTIIQPLFVLNYYVLIFFYDLSIKC